MHAKEGLLVSRALIDERQREANADRRWLAASPSVRRVRHDEAVWPVAIASVVLALFVLLAGLPTMAEAPVSGGLPGPTPPPAVPSVAEAGR